MGLEYITEPQIFLSKVTAERGLLSLSSVEITNNFGMGPALKVDSSAIGPALVVNQNTNQPVAEFKDDGHTVLFIDGRLSSPRRVGINTENPNHALTVNGNISATGTIFMNGILDATSLSLYNPIGNTFVKMGGFNEVYIDLKVPNTDEYDLRIGTNATDSYIKTWESQPLSFDTGNIFFNGGNFSIGAPFANERLTVQGSISSSNSVYGFFVPRTALINVLSDTINLPLESNDVELSAVNSLIVTNFLNGIPGVTYTLTNESTFSIIISSSPAVMVRDGLGLNWTSHSCLSSSNFVKLLKGAACSVRIGSSGFASVW
jgi:hypothetical protein